MILENPDTPLPQFDQVGWVTTRAYQQHDPESKLQEFVKEREASILWLKSLERPNWLNTRHHPKMGAVTAE